MTRLLPTTPKAILGVLLVLVLVVAVGGIRRWPPAGRRRGRVVRGYGDWASEGHGGKNVVGDCR